MYSKIEHHARKAQEWAAEAERRAEADEPLTKALLMAQVHKEAAQASLTMYRAYRLTSGQQA